MSKSPPAENALPAPVMMAQFTLASASMSRQIAASSRVHHRVGGVHPAVVHGDAQHARMRPVEAQALVAFIGRWSWLFLPLLSRVAGQFLHRFGVDQAGQVAAGWPARAARTTRRITFIDRVFGRSLTKITRFGRKARPSAVRHGLCQRTRLRRIARLPRRGHRDADHGRTGNRIRQADRRRFGDACRWPAVACSISVGPMRLPAIFIVSSDRPCRNQNPSASREARSPCTHMPGICRQ